METTKTTGLTDTRVADGNNMDIWWWKTVNKVMLMNVLCGLWWNIVGKVGTGGIGIGRLQHPLTWRCDGGVIVAEAWEQ